jgi:hypothetical protein
MEEEKPRVSVVEKREKAEASGHPPVALTCACEQHLFHLSTRDSKEYPHLTEDDNGTARSWWP